MLVDPDGNWPKWFDNAVASVGASLKGAWNSITSAFGREEAAPDGPSELLLEVEVIREANKSPSEWGGDNSGRIRSANEDTHNTNPTLAFLLDLSAFGLNNLTPLGAIDDLIVVFQDYDATVQEKVNATYDAVMAGAGPKGAPARLKAYPKAKRVNPKSRVSGGGRLRERWEDKKQVYEWDYEKGEVEIYSKSNRKHLGGYDSETGKLLTPAKNRTLKK